MSALNPNHEVTQAIAEQWHKLAAVLVQKAGGHVVISTSDIIDLPEDSAIVVQELHDGIHLRIVDGATARALAIAEGGLPS